MKTHRVNRLIAFTFIPLIEGKNIVDHIDRNRQNNHVDNLRWVSARENNWNRECKGGGTHLTKSGKYVAQIKDNNGKQLHLGTFETKEEAISAYRAKAVELRGAFVGPMTS